MLRFATAFPGRSTPANPDYPYGSAKDETASGVGDGSPILKSRSDDILGLQQALMHHSGIVPSGNADTAKVSDQYNALTKLLTMKFHSVDALRLSDPTIDGVMVHLTSYYDTQLGGGQPVVWDETSTATDNGFTVFKVTAIATGRYLTLVDSDSLTDRMAGVKADGVTDDTARMQVALDNSGDKLTVMTGDIGITSPLTVDRRGFKLFGVSEGGSVIMPIAGFTGSYLFDWGNASASRNKCEIRNIGFTSNGEANITAIRWRRINNTSKILHCSFEILERGIVFDSLALSNTIGYNRFFSVTTNVELINEAGNSTLFVGNYLSGGRVYLNNSMTDIKITNNTFDGSSFIFSDGVSGVRGLEVFGNRFEQTADITPVQLGIIRGLMCSGNSFLGSGFANVAISLATASILARYNIHDNWFEEYLTSYVVAPTVAGGLISLTGNRHDGSAPIPYNVTTTSTPIEGVTSDDGVFRVYTDTQRHGVSQKIITFYVEKSLQTSGVPEDIFNIVTGAVERGGFTCNVEGFANFAPNSTATAAMSVKTSFVHTNANDGTPADSVVAEVYQSASAATASGTRDISNITITNANVDDATTKVQAQATWTGSLAPKVIFEVKLIWDLYATIPTLTAIV